MKFKDFLKEKNTTQEEFECKEANEMAVLYSEYNEKCQQLLKDSTDQKVTKINNDITSINEKVSKMSSTESVEKLKKQLSETKEMVNQLKEAGTGNSTERQTIKQVLEANKDAIIKAFEDGGKHEFTVKTVATTSSVSNNTNSYRDNELSPLAVKRMSVYDLFRKVRVSRNSNGTISYFDWDEDTTSRAAKALAEGEVFAESSVGWMEKSIKMKKIGDSIPVTEEFKYDTAMFADELRNFLDVNVKLEEDAQLIGGAGTGVNLKGVKTYAPAFVPVASGISDASHYDLAVKVAEDITKGKGNKFRPDFVLANLTEINKMRLKKDRNDNYIMPPFVDRNGNNISGMTVIEENGLENNTMIIGDSRYGKIYEDEQGYTLSTDTVDNQFLKDQETLKARKRICLLIKDSEVAGFRKVTDIATALVTLAS